MKREQLWIGGKHIAGQAGVREIRNPDDGSVVGVVDHGSASQMEAAVLAAKQAFAVTKTQPAHERSSVLNKCSQKLKDRKEEIAQLICAECGKPIDYARSEVDRAVFTFQLAAESALHAGEGNLLDMTVASNGVGRQGSYRYFPLGVIAAITPFNFPLNLVAHKVAPAIAAGNAVVLKPAPQTPLTAFVLAEILNEAGLVAGALNLVPCDNDLAETLVRNESVKMVSFTGSAMVGWRLKSLAGKARVTLELGGNGTAIVDEVADWDSFIKACLNAAFNYAGQVCIGLQTLLVRRELFAEAKSRILESIKRVSVGDPKHEGVLVGPMISESAAKKVEGWINEAVSQGAVRLSGAFQAPNRITPTVLLDVPRTSTIWREEAFAPVLILEPYDSIEEAIDIVNSSRYGLQAALFSNNSNKIRVVYDQLEVGGLIVNDFNNYRLDSMPYGGIKDSGFGREGVAFAMREMSEMKLLVTR